MIYKMKLQRQPCRVKEARELYDIPIRSPEDIERLARRLLKEDAQEVFLTFCLDVRNWVIGYTETGRGGFEKCPADPRVIFSSALLSGASGIILVHNHPSSGQSDPSPDDIALTRRIEMGSKLLGLGLLDHLVLGDGSYVSFAEAGLLPSGSNSDDSDES